MSTKRLFLFVAFAILILLPAFGQGSSTDFAAAKGTLPAPISGSYKVSKAFGTNVVGGIELGSKGIFLTGKNGCHARAVYDGKVAAVYEFESGYAVVLRHGSYLTVYARLEEVLVRQGQSIKALTNLGKVGRDAKGDRVLHFQLRQEREVLNPSQWLKL